MNDAKRPSNRLSSDRHPTTFTKNRERLLNEQVMGRLLEKLMAAPEVKPLLSNEHFSMDGASCERMSMARR